MLNQPFIKILLATLLFLMSAAILADETPPQAYILGAEDVIIVTVARHPEFSGDFLIPADGKINIPAAGEIEATGLSIKDFCDVVTTRLKERLIEPEVTVSLKTARMQRVYVLGVVGKPGQFDAKPGWRITEAVAAAGGIIQSVQPSECKASLITVDGARHTVNFSAAITGDPDSNLVVRNGDVLTIEAEETFPVYVVGKVKNPGMYKLRKSSPGLLEAITLAGGILNEAAVSNVSITHTTGLNETVDLTSAIFDGEKKVNSALQSGDLVMVPETTARIAVLGFVRTPGFYPLRDGKKINLAEAIGMAGGADTKRGGISSVAVIRSKDGKQERLTYDLKKFLASGELAQNPDILSGDVVYVPQTSKPDWETVFRAISTVGILINPFMN